MVQRVFAHVTGLPKAAEMAESPLDKVFSEGNEKGRSLVALKDEAADRRRMLERAAQEAGGSRGPQAVRRREGMLGGNGVKIGCAVNDIFVDFRRVL